MGEDQTLSAIKTRVLNDKSAVTYQWLQQKYNVSPNDTESYMKQFLNNSDDVKAEYLKFTIDNVERSVLISLKPSCDYNVELSQYAGSDTSSNNKCSHSIICNEAQCFPRPVKSVNVIINTVKPQVVKKVAIINDKSGKINFPHQPVKKSDTKGKASFVKAPKPKDIKESLKLFDSIISAHATKSDQIMSEKPAEEVINVEIVSIKEEICVSSDSASQKSIKDEKNDCEMNINEDTSKKRHNLFENYENDSPPQTAIKRRRLIIESDDDDDHVLVNDSMIEEKDLDSFMLELKKESKKSTTESSKKMIKEDSKKIAKEKSKKQVMEEMSEDEPTEVKKESKKSTKKGSKKMDKEESNKNIKDNSKRHAKESFGMEMSEDEPREIQVESKKYTKRGSKKMDKEESNKTTKEMSKRNRFEKDQRVISEEERIDSKENIKGEPVTCVSRKRKIMKQVERTFKDEDGFLVTQKVMEAISDDNDDNDNDDEVEHSVGIKSPPLDAPTKMAKKSADACLLGAKKSKQTSLMSFFQKKI